MNDIVKGLLAIGLIIVIGAVVFGVGIMVQYLVTHAYADLIDADEIECNWILCNVRKTVSESIQERTTRIEQNCYINDEQVNCSDITHT